MDPAPLAGLPPAQPVELAGRGTTWARDLAGPAGAATVVLLHGWTATADLNWYPSYGPLSQHFRVVTIDHRGHGRGIRSPDFRLADCADDVAALAAALGIDRCIAVGYSMGGPIAELMWKRHRELVSGLVLCATARRFAPPDARVQAIVGGMYGLSVAARAAPPALRRRVMARAVERRTARQGLADWAADQLRNNDPATVLQAGVAIGRYDCGEWIADVDVPTAVIVTTEDTLVIPERQRRLASCIPGTRVYEVAGGHAACVDQPARFVPVLIEACTDVSGRAASSLLG